MSIKAMKWAYGLFELIDMSPPDRAVLLALCWDHTEKGCFPSQERIALLSGYRDRRVRDILKGLEASGLIARQRVKRAGKYAHTEYRLFGSLNATTGRRGPVDHRHYPAGRNHRQTGAGYRGNIYKGKPDQEILENDDFSFKVVSGGKDA